MGKKLIYQEALSILQNPDSNYGEQKEAGLFFLDSIKKGHDITEAIPSLIDLYYTVNQVPVMDPAGDAICLFYLNHHEYAVLKAFIDKSEFKSFILNSLERVVKFGVEITDLWPFLITYAEDNQFEVFHLLTTHLKQAQDPSATLKAIGTLMLNHPQARKALSFIVQEGAIDHLDMTELLPLMVQNLHTKSKGLRDRVITALHWAVESVSDLTAIIPILEKEIATTHDHLLELGYIITYYFVDAKQFEKITPYLQHPTKNVRLGSIQALGVHFNNDQPTMEILALMVNGLLDKEIEVRTRVLNIFKAVAQKKIPLIISPGQLKTLVQSLQNGANDQLEEYLYDLGFQDRNVAFIIDSTLLALSEHSTPVLVKFKERISVGLFPELILPILIYLRRRGILILRRPH
jgi:hypothetical protein